MKYNKLNNKIIFLVCIYILLLNYLFIQKVNTYVLLILLFCINEFVFYIIYKNRT
jgi:hypothetical protein